MMRRELPETTDVDDEAQRSQSAPTPGDWAWFVVHAVRRRKLVCAGVFLLVLGAAVAWYASRPPMYRVETRILAQRQQALPSALRTGSPDEAPSHSASDIVHRRDNLIALIRQADIQSSSETTGWRRWFRGNPSKEPTEDDLLNGLVIALDEALLVSSSAGAITIQIDWPHPDEAYRIVQAAQQNFIEARHVQEITALDEVISVLQARAAGARELLERANAQARLNASRANAVQETLEAPVVEAPRNGSEELARLKAALDAKERALQDVEDFRRRRLTDLQAQLDQMRGVYSESYPGVMALRQDIAALSRESPQTAVLRDEAQRLQADYAELLAKEQRRSASPPRTRSVPMPREGREPEDETVRQARTQYEHAVERLNAAQGGLDAARAAFKYRYNVVWPAQLPDEPVSPNARKIFGLGMMAAVLLAFAVAAALDLHAGRVLHRWQLERGLGLPIIAEIGRDSGPRGS